MNDFLQNYTIGTVIRMVDADNENHPSLKVLVVPRGTAAKDAATGDEGRPLIDIKFIEDDNAINRVVFYNSDGSVYVDDINNMPSDDEVNAHLNASWTGDHETAFMSIVQKVVNDIISVMQDAHADAEERGIPAQQAFNELITQLQVGAGGGSHEN